jgi:hypothetical protein
MNFSVHFGRTLWAGDQLVPRPLLVHKHRKTHRNIHALSWIRTHDPGFQAGEDSTCLKPLGYRARQCIRIIYKNSVRTSQETDPNPRSRLQSERRQFMP